MKYNINFISSDSNINDIKNYIYNVSDSLPNSKFKDNNIHLPPLIYSESTEGKNPTDISCCYVKVTKNDIINFNKIYPQVLDKEIFINSDILDILINQISEKTYNSFASTFESNKRFNDINAFKHNIELITNIFFSPHPLKNMFEKLTSKYNTIYIKKNPYYIIDMKIDNNKLPNIDEFELKEIKKEGKQEINKIYKINITLTVQSTNKPVTVTSKLSSTCPNKKTQLIKKYQQIMPEFIKNLKKDKPTGWIKNNKGKLTKKLPDPSTIIPPVPPPVAPVPPPVAPVPPPVAPKGGKKFKKTKKSELLFKIKKNKNTRKFRF